MFNVKEIKTALKHGFFKQLFLEKGSVALSTEKKFVRPKIASATSVF